MARATSCVRSFCGRLTGRPPNIEGDSLLTLDQAARACGDLPSERSVQQVHAIRQEFSQLQTALTQAAGAGAAGNFTLQSIQRRLDELEETLQAGRCRSLNSSLISTCVGSNDARLSESSAVSSNCQDSSGMVAEHHKIDRPSRMSTQQMFAAWCRCVWCARRSRSVGSECSFGDGRLDAPVLSSIPEDLQCSAHASETDSVQTITVSADLGDPLDPMSIAGCPIWSKIRRDGFPMADLFPLQTHEFPSNSYSLQQIWKIFSGEDEEWPPVKTFCAMGVTFISVTPWEPLHGRAAEGLPGTLQGGLVRRAHFNMPLKPLPLAPKCTRVTVIYHLRGGSPGEPVVLTNYSDSHDVPFGSCFSVQGQMRFSTLPGSEGRVLLEQTLGFHWHKRCMVKGIVEKSTRSEVAASFKTMLGLLPDPDTSANGEAV